MPIGELVLNAWLLNEVSQIESSFSSCRVSVADHNIVGMYYTCPTVLNVFYDMIAVANHICS